MTGDRNAGPVVIADTRGRFCDFAPYVAAVTDGGIVAWQAALDDGGTGVFSGTGGEIATVSSSPHHTVVSHPDINQRGSVCFYADLDGGQAVFLARDGALTTVADTRRRFRRIGPLGPTLNDDDTIAFRADTRSGETGIYTARDGAVEVVADTRGRFRGFEGLPVVTAAGAVWFRATLDDDRQGIYVHRGGAVEAVVETGDRFSELGRFPHATDDCAVFAATERSGTAGIFTVRGRELSTVVDTSGPFASVRGALVDAAGHVVFYATPRDGSLGVYTGCDPIADRVLAVGASIGGATNETTIAAFALNPVSINDAGQLAIRVALADGEQQIVRAR